MRAMLMVGYRNTAAIPLNDAVAVAVIAGVVKKQFVAGLTAALYA